MPGGAPVKAKKKSKSVLKNARQAEHRTAVNRANITRFRSAIKHLRAAIAAGDPAAAAKLLPETVSAIDRAVVKQVLHGNTADRYKSRLSASLAALRASAAKKN